MDFDQIGQWVPYIGMQSWISVWNINLIKSHSFLYN